MLREPGISGPPAAHSEFSRWVRERGCALCGRRFVREVLPLLVRYHLRRGRSQGVSNLVVRTRARGTLKEELCNRREDESIARRSRDRPCCSAGTASAASPVELVDLNRRRGRVGLHDHRPKRDRLPLDFRQLVERHSQFAAQDVLPRRTGARTRCARIRSSRRRSVCHRSCGLFASGLAVSRSVIPHDGEPLLELFWRRRVLREIAPAMNDLDVRRLVRAEAAVDAVGRRNQHRVGRARC